MKFLIGSVLASTLRVTTPLLLCALAGLVSERSGVIDLGLEGKMLFAAFAAAAAGSVGPFDRSGPAWRRLLVACALSLLHGFACVTHRGDQVVSGVAINMVAAGLTVVLGIAWFQQGGQTPPVEAAVRLTGLSTAYAEPSAGWFNAVIGHGLLSHNILVYLAFALVAGVWFFLERTKPGLRLRAVGENPAMVDAAGVSVPALRYGALMINGLLCGLAGSYLVLAQNAAFSAQYDGRPRLHRPGRDDLRQVEAGADDVRLPAVRLPGRGGHSPAGRRCCRALAKCRCRLIQALPYMLTVVLLAGFIGQALAPKALGRPYVKER